MPDDRVSVPGEPAGPRTQGWYRSPAGVLTHADGPSQVRAYVDRGYVEVDDAAAQRLIGDGVTLTVDDTGDAAGTFDSDAVTQAVENEAPRPRRRRNG